MVKHRKTRNITWLLVWLLALMAGCAENPTQLLSTATPSPSPVLYPYHTVTPSRTPEPFADLTPIPVTPAPTATPFTHKVVKGETMGGIALTYGIKLEDLLAANPTVNPRILSVDTLVIVPLPVGEAAPEPTITPLPLALSMPVCYPSVGQGLSCIVTVENTMDQAVENLSAWMGLFAGDQQLANQVVVPALNLLHSGERIPFVVTFRGPLPADAWLRAELITALVVPDNDARYLAVEVEVMGVEIAANGLSAQVMGRVIWQPDQAVPGTIWVSASAYDAAGNPVGTRKLETMPSCRPEPAVQPCTALDVEMVVYSLGPAIEQVEVLVEARP